MIVRGLAGLVLFYSAVQAGATSEERMDYLYDTLERSMLCEIYASMSQYRGSEEHHRLRGVWMEAGAELGTAMLKDNLPNDDTGYGRRCLVNFELPVAEQITEFAAGIMIGIELGEARSCLRDNAMLNGRLLVDGEDFRDRLKRLGEAGTILFEERNCRYVDFEE